MAQKTELFSGAEIAYIVDEAANEAFYRDEYPDFRYEDLEAAIATTIPLAKREKERIDALRNWANGNARSANIIDKNTSESRLGSRQVVMFS